MSKNNFTLDHYTKRQHVLYWVVVVVIWVFFRLIFDGEAYEPLVNKLCYLPSQLILTYGILYYAIPRLNDKQYLKSGLLFAFLAYFSTALARFTKVYIYETLTGYDSEKESILEILTELSPLMGQYVIWVFLIPIVTLMILLILNHFRDKEKIFALQREKKIAELKFLKSQVHPHFLFNTLNNLYALAVQDSPKTTDVADKLYQILHYLFYKCSTPSVSLGEEITLLDNYIELEKIRYGDDLKVRFDRQEVDQNFRIAPLMLLSLVENSFKHGVSNSLLNPYVDISMKIESDELRFVISNSIAPVNATDERGYRKGIGLSNIKRQLELLYADRHTLDIETRDRSYLVSLRIPQFKELKNYSAAQIEFNQEVKL